MRSYCPPHRHELINAAATDCECRKMPSPPVSGGEKEPSAESHRYVQNSHILIFNWGVCPIPARRLIWSSPLFDLPIDEKSFGHLILISSSIIFLSSHPENFFRAASAVVYSLPMGNHCIRHAHCSSATIREGTFRMLNYLAGDIRCRHSDNATSPESIRRTIRRYHRIKTSLSALSTCMVSLLNILTASGLTDARPSRHIKSTWLYLRLGTSRSASPIAIRPPARAQRLVQSGGRRLRPTHRRAGRRSAGPQRPSGLGRVLTTNSPA
jgi:hypothetical protein